MLKGNLHINFRNLKLISHFRGQNWEFTFIINHLSTVNCRVTVQYSCFEGIVCVICSKTCSFRFKSQQRASKPCFIFMPILFYTYKYTCTNRFILILGICTYITCLVVYLWPYLGSVSWSHLRLCLVEWPCSSHFSSCLPTFSTQSQMFHRMWKGWQQYRLGWLPVCSLFFSHFLNTQPYYTFYW